VDGPNNGWAEWSKYVLKELDRLNECYKDLDKKMDGLHDQINMLQIKVAGIAAGASLITSIVVMLLAGYLRR